MHGFSFWNYEREYRSTRAFATSGAKNFAWTTKKKNKERVFKLALPNPPDRDWYKMDPLCQWLMLIYIMNSQLIL